MKRTIEEEIQEKWLTDRKIRRGELRAADAGGVKAGSAQEPKAGNVAGYRGASDGSEVKLRLSLGAGGLRASQISGGRSLQSDFYQEFCDLGSENQAEVLTYEQFKELCEERSVFIQSAQLQALLWPHVQLQNGKIIMIEIAGYKREAALAKQDLSEPQIKRTIINDKYLAAISQYENALASLDELYSGSSSLTTTSTAGPALQTRNQAVDLIRSIQTPVSIQLAECYLCIDEVEIEKSIEMCTKIL